METVTLPDLARIVNVLEEMQMKPGQAGQLLRCFKNLSSDQVQKILERGILDKLAKVGDFSQVNMAELFRATQARFGVSGVVTCGMLANYKSLLEYCKASGIKVDTSRLTWFEEAGLGKTPLIQEPTTLSFTKVSLGKLFGKEFGDDEGKKEKAIVKCALGQGLSLCPLEMTFFLPVQYRVNSYIQMILGSTCTPRGLKASFEATSKKISLKPWTEHCRDGSHGWRSHSEWIFTVPQMK